MLVYSHSIVFLGTFINNSSLKTPLGSRDGLMPIGDTHNHLHHFGAFCQRNNHGELRFYMKMLCSSISLSQISGANGSL